MSEPHNDIPSITPRQEGLSRRRMLELMGFGGLAGLGLLALGAKDTFEWWEDWHGRMQTEQLFTSDGLWNWSKLSIVPNLVQIDPTVKVSTGMFNPPDTHLYTPKQGFTVAALPIAVRSTILRNIDSLDPGNKSEVDRALPSISPGLLAFYAPNNQTLVFCDADQNDGLLTPITSGYIVGRHLGVADIDITDRQARGDVVYPYTSRLELQYTPAYSDKHPKPVEIDTVVGHSFCVFDSVGLNNAAINYDTYGRDPIAIPPA